MSVVTRFAPSPTGLLHIGGVRTALFSWLYARHHAANSSCGWRIPTAKRSTDEAVRVILEGMNWLGLTADEGPYYRRNASTVIARCWRQLLGAGHAYRCYAPGRIWTPCASASWRQSRSPATTPVPRPPDVYPRASIRSSAFQNPLDGEVLVDDQIHGRVVFQNSGLDGLIIARSDGNRALPTSASSSMTNGHGRDPRDPAAMII